MFQELRFFLNQTTSPEHGDYLIRAASTLEAVGLTSVGDYLEEFMATLNQRTTVESLGALESLLKTQTEQAINQFGIFLVDTDFSLKVATYILMGVHQVENYDNPMAILDICQSDTDPEEKLAEILGLVTPLTWMDYLSTIQGVNQSLIDRLVEALPTVEENETVPETQTFILVRTKRYLELNPRAWVLDEVDNGLIIGQGLDFYVDAFNTRYHDKSQEAEVSLDILSQEFVGYLLLTNLPDEKLLEVQSDALESILSNPVDQSKVSVRNEALLNLVLNPEA